MFDDDSKIRKVADAYRQMMAEAAELSVDEITDHIIEHPERDWPHANPPTPGQGSPSAVTPALRNLDFSAGNSDAETRAKYEQARKKLRAFVAGLTDSQQNEIRAAIRASR